MLHSEIRDGRLVSGQRLGAGPGSANPHLGRWTPRRYVREIEEGEIERRHGVEVPALNVRQYAGAIYRTDFLDSIGPPNGDPSAQGVCYLLMSGRSGHFNDAVRMRGRQPENLNEFTVNINGRRLFHFGIVEVVVDAKTGRLRSHWRSEQNPNCDEDIARQEHRSSVTRR